MEERFNEENQQDEVEKRREEEADPERINIEKVLVSNFEEVKLICQSLEGKFVCPFCLKSRVRLEKHIKLHPRSEFLNINCQKKTFRQLAKSSILERVGPRLFKYAIKILADVKIQILDDLSLVVPRRKVRLSPQEISGTLSKPSILKIQPVVSNLPVNEPNFIPAKGQNISSQTPFTIMSLDSKFYDHCNNLENCVSGKFNVPTYRSSISRNFVFIVNYLGSSLGSVYGHKFISNIKINEVRIEKDIVFLKNQQLNFEQSKKLKKFLLIRPLLQKKTENVLFNSKGTPIKTEMCAQQLKRFL